MSRSQVHRIVANGPPDGEDDYDETDLDDDPERPLAEPFTFVGLATVEDYRGRPCVDSTGVGWACNALAVDQQSLVRRAGSYRHRQYLEHECDDPEGAKRVVEECYAQLERAGVRYDERRKRWVQD